ncbi:MAG TPA: hypothetical protein VFX51_27390 [Solirubrobacteraceae bacterium]|nr:hypothetical protein [Solirubrobacteraceae bacterium]
MNLARHASVLWRFRRVTAVGVVLGISLAIFAGYHVGSNGLTPRGTSTYSAVSSIWVTQAGFPEGRVALPQTPIGSVASTEDPEATQDEDTPTFADPARLSGLGDFYSKLLTSDIVLSKVPGHPPAAAVQASPFASSQGGLLLPVIQLTTMGPTPAAAQKTNLDVYKALRDYLDEEAQRNDIKKADLVELKVLVAPTIGLVSRPKPTMSILVFILVMLGTLAVTHLLEALRNRKQETALATIVDWDAPSSVLRDPVDDSEAERAGSNGAGVASRLRR